MDHLFETDFFYSLNNVLLRGGPAQQLMMARRSRPVRTS